MLRSLAAALWAVAGTISWVPNCTFRKRCPIEARKMAAGDQYRTKAAEFYARAQSETRPQLRVQFENVAKAHLCLAEQADWNDRGEAVHDLYRQVRAGAKSKRDPYEPPRARSTVQTEQVASITERMGRMPTHAGLGEIARAIPFFATLLVMTFLAVIVFW